MTYNFDPERWYENHLAALEARRPTMTDKAYRAAGQELEKRYDEMLARLDGTYRLPDKTTD